MKSIEEKIELLLDIATDKAFEAMDGANSYNKEKPLSELLDLLDAEEAIREKFNL